MYRSKLLKLAATLKNINQLSAAIKITKIADDINPETNIQPQYHSVTQKQFESIWKRYQQRAKELSQKLKSSKMTQDDIKAILNLKLTNKDDIVKCAYCGDELPFNLSTSLDRIDNNKGYVLGNLVFSCFECNKVKGKNDLDDIFQFINDVSKTIPDLQNGKQTIQNKGLELKTKVEQQKVKQNILEFRKEKSTQPSAGPKKEDANIINALELIQDKPNPKLSYIISNVLVNLQQQHPDTEWNWKKVERRILRIIEDLKDSNNPPNIIKSYYNTKKSLQTSEQINKYKQNINAIHTQLNNSIDIKKTITELSDEYSFSPLHLVTLIKNDKTLPPNTRNKMKDIKIRTLKDDLIYTPSTEQDIE